MSVVCVAFLCVCKLTQHNNKNYKDGARNTNSGLHERFKGLCKVQQIIKNAMQHQVKLEPATAAEKAKEAEDEYLTELNKVLSVFDEA